jgi:integrase
MRGIYRRLVDYGFIGRNPFLVAVPKGSPKGGTKRPTQAVPRDKVKAILNMRDAHTHEGLRDRAFLALLFGCAIRLQSALNLKLSDIYEDYVALRHAKGVDYRAQVMPGWVAKRITDFKLARLKEGARDCDPFLVAYYAAGAAKNSPISARTGRRLFKRLMFEAGLPANITPHSARATAITRALEKGQSYREVQELSGHTSVRMVEQYDKRRFDRKNSPAKKLDY